MDSPLPPDLRVLTLNCWGLKYISKLRPERLVEIGRRIASQRQPPHLVALQECWVSSDYEAIRAEVSSVLPHGKFYRSGPFGAGLAILSRWPIEESGMHPYPLNGRPTAFWRGDWYVGKGIAFAKIRIRLFSGREQVLSVFNTHTHAPYTEGQPDDSYLAHRLSQSWEMSKLLRGAAERGHLVLALGDFNMRPLSLPHRIITAHAPVLDAWRVLHPDSSLGASADPLEKPRGRPVPTAEFNLLENGATSDGSYNTWRWPAEKQKLLGEGRGRITVDSDTPDPKGKRLDYVFFGDGAGWAVRDARVGMVEPHPKLGCSLSDHFSVEATFTYRGPGEKAVKDSTEPAQVEPVDSPSSASLDSATYDEILSVTRRYVQREEKQRYWRGLHFFAWLAVWVGCLVGVWFSPHNFVAFILMLLSSLGLVAGVIDGLMSLLFFNSELRALKEFEWEISNAKAMARRGSAASGEKEEPL
ncbi:inositol phosphosphingolipids phospholipase C protein (endonuclease/exonuclease/phosphatase) [Colletotrichum sojae]|uniref:Inositol phosphosphingolipids phospholipase C protein (Endonuclease/exonuclease/phosphatase) n=1 Tax=Colletotrichum sojae TaxID=2175907 RepID=A0A8H6JHH6_9PEZI|nr:inositol phosphosphingolipids phospholipase C protein (endonuclease/exonuclease/phosphatase) [Colletotrichum sojae]